MLSVSVKESYWVCTKERQRKRERECLFERERERGGERDRKRDYVKRRKMCVRSCPHLGNFFHRDIFLRAGALV